MYVKKQLLNFIGIILICDIMYYLYVYVNFTSCKVRDYTCSSALSSLYLPYVDSIITGDSAFYYQLHLFASLFVCGPVVKMSL